MTRSFDVFFDLRLNKRLSKQSWGWWFETLSRPLWRHCNVYINRMDESTTIDLQYTTKVWQKTYAYFMGYDVDLLATSGVNMQIVKLLYRFEIWQAPREYCCRDTIKSERSDDYEHKSHSSETLRLRFNEATLSQLNELPRLHSIKMYLMQNGGPRNGWRATIQSKRFAPRHQVRGNAFKGIKGYWYSSPNFAAGATSPRGKFHCREDD